MPAKLTTPLNKIKTKPKLILFEYMKESDVSDNHHNDCQRAVIAFANFLGANTTFYDIRSKERITTFLDTKIKSREEDPDRKCNYNLESSSRPSQIFYRMVML